jgi:hypothetical protein
VKHPQQQPEQLFIHVEPSPKPEVLRALVGRTGGELALARTILGKQQEALRELEELRDQARAKGRYLTEIQCEKKARRKLCDIERTTHKIQSLEVPIVEDEWAPKKMTLEGQARVRRGWGGE